MSINEIYNLYHNDNILAPDRLGIYYHQTKQVLNQINYQNKNNIRIITHNVHFWENYKTHKSNIEEILTDILEIEPTIICFQEYIEFDKVINRDNKSIINKFLNKYDVLGFSKSDPVRKKNNLYLIDIIFIKKEYSKQSKVILQTDHNIQYKNDGRTCVICRINVNNYNFILVNTHLDTDPEHQKHNMELLLKHLHPEQDQPIILLGDFNSYLSIDYTESQLKNLKSNLEKNNIPLNLVDNLACYYKKYNFNDVFALIKNKHKKNIIPINTTRYGGKVDYIFLNKKFIEQNYQFYAFNMFSEWSDHTSLIIDIRE
jgi:endonuclease/exonuclease/phosphatase family metal-dependent hydrolase